MPVPSAWHRRQALMLASQLPESTEDAQMVLRAVSELLGFIEGAALMAAIENTALGNVLPFSPT